MCRRSWNRIRRTPDRCTRCSKVLDRFRGSTTVPTDVVKTRPDSCHESRRQLGADPRKGRTVLGAPEGSRPIGCCSADSWGPLNLPDEDLEVGLRDGSRAPNRCDLEQSWPIPGEVHTPHAADLATCGFASRIPPGAGCRACTRNTSADCSPIGWPVSRLASLKWPPTQARTY